jgi:hypothetical protein
MYSTGAKGSTQTNKKIQVRVQKKESKETEENPGLAHRTVRCATGQCSVTRVVPLQTCHLWEFGKPLRYNSPECPVHQAEQWLPPQRSTSTVITKCYSAQQCATESERTGH